MAVPWHDTKLVSTVTQGLHPTKIGIAQFRQSSSGFWQCQRFNLRQVPGARCQVLCPADGPTCTQSIRR